MPVRIGLSVVEGRGDREQLLELENALEGWVVKGESRKALVAGEGEDGAKTGVKPEDDV